MKTRYYLILMLGTLLWLPMAAGRITPREARDIARSFRAERTERLQAPGLTPTLEPTLSATVRNGSGLESLYIFNYPSDQGFAIVSADGEHPAVLGYSDTGSFDYAKAPSNVRWWLSQYVQTIDRASAEAGAADAAEEDFQPVEPMVKTQWNQSAPYNDDCPMDGTEQSVTGCMATAMAQIMNYHQWPSAAQGTAFGTDMTQFTFQWDLMLDDYAASNYTEEQAAAVAELMYACGVSVDMEYSADESSASAQPVASALVNNFNYSTTVSMLSRNYYSYADWEKMVYDELAASRPVLYTGQATEGGHAFVCDGYSANGYFHFNWGWAGMYDGYFLLDSLDPGTGGIGSFAGGYNSSQIIFTGIQPAYSSQPSNMQTALCVDGNFVYSGENENYGCYEFAVSESPTQQEYFYNPLGYAEAVSPGLKVVSATDSSSVSYQQSLYAVSELESGAAFTTIYCTLPSLDDGDYRVYPAYIDGNGNWHDASVLDTYQDYVDLNMASGVATFTNTGLHDTLTPDLILNAVRTAGPVYSDEYNPMQLIITNIGDEDFSGTLTARLTNPSTDAEVYSFTLTVAVPARSTRSALVTKVVSAPEGDYDFALYHLGHRIGDRVALKVAKALAAHTSSLKVTECGPTFAVSGQNYSLDASIYNSSSIPVGATLTFSLYDASSESLVSSRTLATEITFAATSLRTIDVMPFKLTAHAGEYYWVVTDSEGTAISGRFPVRVVEGPYEADGITYYVYDYAGKKGYVSRPANNDSYSGDVEIPEKAGDVTLTAILPGTFTYSTELTSVSIPASISELTPGEFYGCSSLRDMTVMSTEPPTLGYKALPSTASEIYGTVPYGAANLYARAEGWSDLKWGNWEIVLPAALSYDPAYLIDTPASTLTGDGLLKDPATGLPYSPYYVSKDETPTMKVVCPGDTTYVAMISIDGITPQQDYPAEDAITLPALDGASGECRFDQSLAAVALLSDDEPVDVFTLTGIRVAQGATRDRLRDLPAGIYVVGKRKVAVR